MAISFGPKLGLLYNALINETYYDSLRLFLQSMDQLVNGSVLNATQVTPPSSPNPGDAYLLIGGTPGGAWTGQSGKIAFWDAQLTQSGTNNVVPGWVFLTPIAGWLVWNVSLAGLYVYNGTSWTAIGGSGANYPVNTDITSMTGLTNQTINSSGYAYNDGTNPAINIGDNGTGSQIAYGSTVFGTGNGVIIGSQTWTGTGLSGPGIGITTGGATIVMANGSISASGTLSGNTIQSVGTGIFYGQLQLGSGTTGTLSSIVGRGTTNTGVAVGSDNMASAGVAFQVLSGSAAITNGVGLMGFDVHYPTQSTVGSAGSASAPPANPLIWLQLQVYVSGTPTTVVVPCYKQS